MNKQESIERLSKEWKEHGMLCIAVDFDDTIYPYKSSSQQHCDHVINLVKLARQTGAYITIWSACNEDRYPEIQEYCNKKDLIIDSINKNPIELPYGNNKKIYCNIYIDDRAGLQESLEILETCIYKQRGYLEQQKLFNSELD